MNKLSVIEIKSNILFKKNSEQLNSYISELRKYIEDLSVKLKNLIDNPMSFHTADIESLIRDYNKVTEYEEKILLLISSIYNLTSELSLFY